MMREKMIDAAVRLEAGLLDYARVQIQLWDGHRARGGGTIAEVGIRNMLSYGAARRIRKRFREASA